jgi:hypothetical protein
MAHRLGVIDRLPEIPRPPQGEHRTRFLSEEEITLCWRRAVSRGIVCSVRW